MSEQQPKPKSTKKTAKSTQAQIIQRLSEIKDMLLSGHTRSDIQRYAMNQNWGVGPDQVDKYMSQATREIQEIAQADATTDISILIRNLWDLYRKAVKEGNLAEGHKITMSLAKLRGYDQTTVNHKFERNPEHAKLSDEELEKAMAQAMESRH